MSTNQLIGSVFLALASSFLISGISYRLSGLMVASKQYYNKDKELFLFNFLGFWHLAIGVYFFLYNDLLSFLKSHDNVYKGVAIYCALLAGLYSYKVKHKYSYAFSKLDVLSNLCEMLKIMKVYSLGSEIDISIPLFSRLFSLAKAIESFDEANKLKWLMHVWKITKIYILNIKD